MSELSDKTASLESTRATASKAAKTGILLPLVAIVTPVYNGAEYLDATMRSVQRQTYSNIIHVILDNASTDGTAAIIERYKDGAVPLSVHRNPKTLPQSDNWNAALKLVPPGARYVQWLCADDLIRSDAIEKLVAKAETDEKICVVGAVDVVMNYSRAPHLAPGCDVVDGVDWIKAVCGNRYGHFPWQAFFVRWTAEDRASQFFPTMVTTFDTVAVLRKMAGGKVGFVLDPLIFTRHHANNVSNTLGRSHNTAHRFWRWEANLTYASVVGDRQESRRMLQSAKFFLLRFQLYYLLVGARDAYKAVAQRLSADGHPPRVWEYLAAVASYPVSYLSLMLRKLRANKQWPEEITESRFLSL